MGTRTMYMHTLDGKPACMDRDGTQIVFARGRYRARLVDSLREIRREQRQSVKWRMEQGFNIDFRHGYVLVEVPSAEAYEARDARPYGWTEAEERAVLRALSRLHFAEPGSVATSTLAKMRRVVDATKEEA
jgi:hypothetical protein